MVFNPGSMRRTCYPDKNWKQEIPKAVRASDVVIVCFSRHSVNKAGYIQKEIKYALNAAIVILGLGMEVDGY